MRRSLITLLLVACTPATSTAPPERPGSRGMRADDHLDAAREHARRAKELASWPDARTNGTGRFDAPSTGLWYRAWDTAPEHERLAATHQSAAGQLQAAYDEACGATSMGEVSVSPLQRYGIGGAPAPDGVMVFLLPEAGPADRLIASMQCHRAWMMLGESGMEDCPLDLEGIQIEAHGDDKGITVEIKLRDPKLIPELQRRVARDLEKAFQSRHAAPR